jgi:iron complex transport system substrate-binding protein
MSRTEAGHPRRNSTFSRRSAVQALGLLSLPFLGCGRESHKGSTRRLVALGGTITEIVSALGALPDLVGVDTSSVYPVAAARLPKVGYFRRFSPEGVIALSPTLVLLSTEAGPPGAVEQLRTAGVALVPVPVAHTIAQARARISMLGGALSVEAPARTLLVELDADLKRTADLVAKTETRPRVLFVYARGRAMRVAGKETGADTMIQLAGARNAASEFAGLRPLTAEGVVAAAPDVLLLTTRAQAELGGAAALTQIPGIALTPAGRNRRLVALDDLFLLGFGPRAGAAAFALASALHREPG